MKKKYSALVLPAAVLLALAATLGFSLMTYGQEQLSGRAGIKIVSDSSSSDSSSSDSSSSDSSSSDSSSSDSSSSDSSSSGSASSTSYPSATFSSGNVGNSRDGSTRRDGDAGTVTIEDSPVPEGTVSILDPTVPLSGLPALPQTGGNSAAMTLALFLFTAGGAMILHACKGAGGRI